MNPAGNDTPILPSVIVNPNTYTSNTTKSSFSNVSNGRFDNMNEVTTANGKFKRIRKKL